MNGLILVFLIILPIVVLYAVLARTRILERTLMVFVNTVEDAYWETISGEKGRGDERRV